MEKVFEILPVELRNGSEGCNRAVLISAVHRVCAGSKGLTLLSAVGRRAGVLSVGYVRGYCKNGGRSDTVSVGLMLS